MPWTYSILTAYHFGPSDCAGYSRLLQSLRSSALEIGGHGRIILIANGTYDFGAERPGDIIASLGALPTTIVPIEIYNNSKSTGALNQGILEALSFGDEPDHLIISVQSSAVLCSGWIREISGALASDPRAIGAFGRLLAESDQNKIWADGHYVLEGSGYNANMGKNPAAVRSVDTPNGRPPFPCLSAAAFRASAVATTCKLYGDFVSTAVTRYGDCPDVALRLHAATKCNSFAFAAAAHALKRKPELRKIDFDAARIVFGRHYLRQPSVSVSIEATELANQVSSRSYAPSGESPPLAGCFDPY